MGAVLAFILEHLELFELLGEAIKKGVDREVLRDSIKATMVAASDAEMKRELG
jgi:hypothetical protein